MVQIRAAVKAGNGRAQALRAFNQHKRMIPAGKKRQDIPMRHDPKLAISADLIRRIDGLAGERGHWSVPRLHDELDQIRHLAGTFGFDAVESLAGTLESALSLHGMEPVMLCYLDRMRDAVGSAMPPLPVMARAAAPVIALRA
jgi:hypothetical protein